MGPLGGIGLPEIIIVLVIALLIFGPKRLPGLGKSLGSGLREFKDSVGGGSGRSEIAETGEFHDDEREPVRTSAERRPARGSAEPEPEPEPVTAEPVAGGAARDTGRDTVS